MSELEYQNQQNCKCTNIDPTAIIRLHSIISGSDIFTLTQKYNYSTRHLSNLIYSMRLPDEFRELLKNIKDIRKIARDWSDSDEIRFYGWSLKKTTLTLSKIKTLCVQDEYLNMDIGGCCHE